MVSVKCLSPSGVEDILNAVDPKRRFSEAEISDATLMLNNFLSQYALSEEEYSEPTSIQLGKDVDDLHAALKHLKRVLPKPKQHSLFNYLVDLGERYADKTGKPHPNLKPIWGGHLFENGGEASWIENFRSDQRLREMIDNVTEVLAWMDHGQAKSLGNLDWVDRKPDMTVFERLEPNSTPPTLIGDGQRCG